MAAMPDAIMQVTYGELTLRDYFAAAALTTAMKENDWRNYKDSTALEAYQMADAMLRMREVDLGETP